MDIEILKNLEANPHLEPSISVNKPMTLSEIASLELLYNLNGNPFPKAVKELLFLGGNYNWIFGSSDEFMQNFIREEMAEDGLVITRPFLVLYNYDQSFGFVYLDEGVDNPIYRYVLDWGDPSSPGATTPYVSEDRTATLSEEIDLRIKALRENY
jgi:hypothetical protein